MHACTFHFFNTVFVYANTCEVRTRKNKLMVANAGFVYGLKQSPWKHYKMFPVTFMPSLDIYPRAKIQ